METKRPEHVRTISIEEHFFSTAFSSTINSSTPIGLPWAQLTDLGAGRLKDMDAGGIDLQVVSHNVFSFEGGDIVQRVQETNDQLAAAVRKYPTRFAGFATLPMTNPEDAANELERTVRSFGFKGAMINGITNGLFLDDPSFLPIFERAIALSVPIYLHPGFPPAPVREVYYAGPFDPSVNFILSRQGWGWHSEVGLHALRLIISGIFDRLPTLQIIIGHMGEMIPFMLSRIDDTLTPVAKHLKHKVSEYIHGNFYITTSGFFTNPPLLTALQTIGSDRIIFSVDYPYSSNEQGRAFLDNAPISPDDKAKISHLNAERLLGLARE